MTSTRTCAAGLPIFAGSSPTIRDGYRWLPPPTTRVKQPSTGTAEYRLTPRRATTSAGCCGSTEAISTPTTAILFRHRPSSCVQRHDRSARPACASAMARVVIAKVAFAVGIGFAAGNALGADAVATIARVKTAVVAMGTFEPTRSPQFAFRGTGFVVGDGTLVVTNAHVVPEVTDAARREVFGFVMPRVGE